MKRSLQKSVLPSLVVIAGSLGLTAAPAVGQLSTLPPLHCASSCFVPLDGIAVPGLEVVPWTDPRATTFLNNFGTSLPSESQIRPLIDSLGLNAITQAIQSNVNDPALVNSFGQILVILANSTPNLAALQQPEADFIAWLQANVSSGGGNTVILEALANTGSVEFARAVAAVLMTLPQEEIEAIEASPQALQAFLNSLPPQTPAAQVSLSQRSQGIIYDYLLGRAQLRDRLRDTTRIAAPGVTLDTSDLNLHTLPTSDRMNPHGVAQTSTNGAVGDALQSEVEAYQMAYGAADLFKADASDSESEISPIAQDADIDLASANPPWSVFISGDIAWGNAQGTPDFDVNNYVIMAGADYRLNPNFLLGGAVAYSTGSQRNNVSTAEADSVSFNLYGTGQYGTGGYTAGFLSYGFDNFNSRRTILSPGVNLEATGSTSGNQFNVGLETGWVFFEGGFFLQPSLGLRYTSNHVNGYTEAGAGPWSTVVDSYNTDSTIANLGFDVTYPIATGDRYILPFVGIGLNHRLGYSAPVVTARFVGGGGSFVTPVADVDYTWFDLSAGVSADLSRNTVGQIIFRTDLGRFDSHLSNFSINLRHDF